ncbi:hypothetical protein QBD01_003728 [Ochrobactrum sp. 19YEA23]|uniref:DUF551 domain-containing protein n=1 Tax=Ochrobactrum sp. 19YEA23 TaxID=3039854 RepID=UPI002478881F|nr:hypothetical protein [Ochrobactrum sp. 19YEA23]
MTIPEQAVQAAANAIRRAGDTYTEMAKSALTAAAPHLAAVRVKDEGKLLMEVTQAIFPEGWTLSNRNAVADGIRIVLSALEPSAGGAALLEEAARIAFDISENGEYHGEASVDSASSIYQQGAFEVYEAIRALASHPVADKPDQAGAQGWISTGDRLPEKPGLSDYEYVECLIFVNGSVEIGHWNCEHLCWDDEDHDDFLYNPQGPTHWRPLPTLPSGEVA